MLFLFSLTFSFPHLFKLESSDSSSRMLYDPWNLPFEDRAISGPCQSVSVCADVSVYLCVSMCVLMCQCVLIYQCVCVCLYVSVFVCVSVCLYISVFVCVSVLICVSICICVGVWVYKCLLYFPIFLYFLFDLFISINGVFDIIRKSWNQFNSKKIWINQSINFVRNQLWRCFKLYFLFLFSL